MFVQGLGEALQPVQAVRVLLGHHDRADAGLAFHQPLGTQQVQGLADGVAGGAVVVGEGASRGSDAAGEAAGQDLVAQQVGELPRLVRAQPPPARGGDRDGVRDGSFGWHGREHTDGPAPVVLPECCATWRRFTQGSDLRFRRGGGKICHPADRGMD